MKKQLPQLSLLVGLGICLLSGGTHAYMTAYDAKVNQASIGYQKTSIVEEFPTPTPAKPENNPSYKKSVTVLNENTAGNVACYIRARILYSNSDLGNLVTLQNLDTTNWEKRADGYYYYRHLVKPGQKTTPLFTAVSVNGAKAGKQTYWYADDFAVTIYEESIQAVGYSDAKTAWEAFLHYRI